MTTGNRSFARPIALAGGRAPSPPRDPRDADRAAPAKRGRQAAVAVFVLFVTLAGSLSAAAELIAAPESGWPQFRGPRRDGISDERGLLPTWPEGGPKLLWSARGLPRFRLLVRPHQENSSAHSDRAGASKSVPRSTTASPQPVYAAAGASAELNRVF